MQRPLTSLTLPAKRPSSACVSELWRCWDAHAPYMRSAPANGTDRRRDRSTTRQVDDETGRRRDRLPTLRTTSAASLNPLLLRLPPRTVNCPPTPTMQTALTIPPIPLPSITYLVTSCPTTASRSAALVDPRIPPCLSHSSRMPPCAVSAKRPPRIVHNSQMLLSTILN
jgi:hypothetical protein